MDRFVFLGELIGVDTGVVKNGAHRADTAGHFGFSLRHQDRFVATDLAHARCLFRENSERGMAGECRCGAWFWRVITEENSSDPSNGSAEVQQARVRWFCGTRLG